MTDKEIINALDDADVFLRNRANAKTAPLNEYDIEILLDIAKICDKASKKIKQQQKQLENYSHNVRNMSKDFIEQHKIIQEQQAEIQALREDIHNRKARENKLRSKIKSFKIEIERLKEELEIRNQKRASIFEISNAYERGRTEAIKEFADRLKCKKATFYCICGVENDYTDILNTHIDNLVKEMVGEQE